MVNKDNIDERSAEGANYTEAINQLLAAVNCPKKVRQFLDTLIGYADGKIEIAVFDLELGQRADPERNEDAATKWVQRNRKNLLEWQNKNDIVLIEFKRGFKDRNNRNVPSRYYLHLTKYVKRILEEAQKDKVRWDKYPHAAIELATWKYISEIITSPIIFPAVVQKPKDVKKEISTRFRQAITHLEKISDLLMENSRELTKEHSDLFQALELSVEDLSIYFEDEDL